MSQTQLPPVQPYHPTTFLERGVAVPFTTPLLGGTRARPAADQGLELVIPNPSGGRGVYVMPWAAITSLCQPTLHDKVFNTRIAALQSVTPAMIRRIAQEIAAEGLVGEEAMETARQATDNDKGDRLLTNYLLLMNLIAQVNLLPAAAPGSSDHMYLGQDASARLTVAWVAPRIGQSADWIASALEALADLMANIGVAAVGPPVRIPRLISLLRTTRSEIADWSREQREDDQASYARMICSVADFTLTLAGSVLSRANGLTANMVQLLRTWAADPESVVQQAGRPEWLLDGWEQICLIWNFAADDAARRAALVEIAGLVPVLPREVNDWCDSLPEASAAFRVRRLVRLNEDWRTGATVFDLIARNEHFRAVTL
ncbi:MAG: hypothetical protein EXR07_19800 [Acetobacteraceae bacterium]|nr:hypothetical protein [Acetobacteraceae bacterium]